ALSKAGGTAAKHACYIMLGLFHAEALLGYAVSKPWDLTGFHCELQPIGNEFVNPFAKTLSGDAIWVQPMIRQGEALRELISAAWAYGFEARDHLNSVRFNPWPMSPVQEAIAREKALREQEAAQRPEGDQPQPSV